MLLIMGFDIRFIAETVNIVFFHTLWLIVLVLNIKQRFVTRMAGSIYGHFCDRLEIFV